MSTRDDRDASSASSGPPDPDPSSRDDERRERGFVSRQAARSGRWAATTAATTVLAAALISGAGATAAAADAPVSPLPEAYHVPRVQEPAPGGAAPGAAAGAGEAQERRAADVAAELSEAVAHGDVTQKQADAFLAKLLVRFSSD